LKRGNLTFLMERENGLTVGKKLYFELVDCGCQTVELPDSVLRRYVCHLAHTTRVLNAADYHPHKRTVQKTRRLLEKIMDSNEVKSIQTDASLDVRCF